MTERDEIPLHTTNGPSYYRVTDRPPEWMAVPTCPACGTPGETLKMQLREVQFPCGHVISQESFDERVRVARARYRAEG